MNPKKEDLRQKLQQISKEADYKTQKEPFGIVLLLPLIFGFGFIYYASEVVLGLEQWTRDFVDRYSNTTLTLFTLAVKLVIAFFCLLTTIYAFMRKKRAVATARIALWIWFVFIVFEIIAGYINVSDVYVSGGFSLGGGQFFYALFTVPILILSTAAFVYLMLFLNRSKRLDEVLTKK
ncbi:MAG: hypothetical protein LBJ11_00475 [Oscillospiraceae bacterium]|jgi:hypothetical protein|nr:hypothetical protein [Oscillospiraceae bacterium]